MNVDLSEVETNREYVESVAGALVEKNDYEYGRKAFGQCSKATSALSNWIGELVSFEVETKVTEVPDRSWWAKDKSTPESPDYLWHWVLVVPQVGIVDITGSQLGKDPIRVLDERPEAWIETRSVKSGGAAPDPVDIDARLCSSDPLPASETFPMLLSLDQETLF